MDVRAKPRVIPNDLGHRDPRMATEHRHDQGRARALRAEHEDGPFRRLNRHDDYTPFVYEPTVAKGSSVRSLESSRTSRHPRNSGRGVESIVTCVLLDLARARPMFPTPSSLRSA